MSTQTNRLKLSNKTRLCSKCGGVLPVQPARDPLLIAEAVRVTNLGLARALEGETPNPSTKPEYKNPYSSKEYAAIQEANLKKIKSVLAGVLS